MRLHVVSADIKTLTDKDAVAIDDGCIDSRYASGSWRNFSSLVTIYESREYIADPRPAAHVFGFGSHPAGEARLRQPSPTTTQE